MDVMRWAYALLCCLLCAGTAQARSTSVELQVRLVVLPSCTIPSSALLEAGEAPQCNGGVKPKLSYTRESIVGRDTPNSPKTDAAMTSAGKDRSDRGDKVHIVTVEF
jgi:hypothetical protein